MRLLHTMLRVGDLQRSIDFYTRVLGMKLLRTTERPEQKYSLAFVGYGSNPEQAEIAELRERVDALGELPEEVRKAVDRELGDPLVDSYLAFVAGRARPNTLRAVAHDLKTFFTIVDKTPADVAAAFVEACMEVLISKCRAAIKEYPVSSLVIVGGVAAELRRVAHRVLQAVVRRERVEQVPGRVGQQRHDRQFQDRADHQRVWWNIRSQRVRVKKWANTETSPLTVAPALSSW